MLKTFWQKRGGYINWYLQRCSALIISVFVLLVFWQWLANGLQSIIAWHLYLHHPIPFVLGALAFLSLILHAYIGVWTVLTDYIHHSVLSKVLHFVTALGALIMVSLVLHVLIGVGI